MRFIVFVFAMLAIPSLGAASPCSNPRTCEGPAWLKSPPKGTIVAKANTRLAALSKALLATAEYLQSQVNEYAAGRTEKQTAPSLMNQEICGLKIKGMTKKLCSDKNCAKTSEQTQVTKVTSKAGLEIKFMESQKQSSGRTEYETNVSMTGQNTNFRQMLAEARKRCVINEVFFQDMIWVAIKLGK